MRAYRYENGFGLDELKIVELPEPQAGPGEAVVRVRANSLNYRDLMILRGAYGSGVKLPLIPLSDGAGEVATVGSGVTRVKVGDRVAASFFAEWIGGKLTEEAANSALGGSRNGMLAEFVVLNEQALVKLPEHLSYEEGATLPCAAVTAWDALVVRGKLQAGQTVLVLGTGGVSIFALQFARMMGARVIATSSSDEKLERVRALGATDTINYKTTSDWERRVLELTNGRGVDHVVEVGGMGTMAKSIESVGIGGRIYVIGGVSGREGQMNPFPLLRKSARLQGIYVGSREMFDEMNRAIAVNQMRPVIDRTFGFAEAKEALRYMESAAHFGKIVIRQE